MGEPEGTNHLKDLGVDGGGMILKWILNMMGGAYWINLAQVRCTCDTKIRIFNACVKSVLLYGCETWLVTKGIQRKIQTFVNRCLRHIY